MTVAAGDVVVIPAGVGHKAIEASPDLGIVGAYPSGTGQDLCRGAPGERPRCLEAIARVAVPDSGPALRRPRAPCGGTGPELPAIRRETHDKEPAAFIARA